MVDLLVIGAGLSGLTAAYTAAKSGLSVKIVSKGLSALHWCAGTIDVLGYVPGAQNQLVEMPFETIAALSSEDNPHHPYAIVGSDRLKKSLTEFSNLALAIGLPYRGAAIDGQNLLLPSPVGAIRPTYLAPAAQAAGDLRQRKDMLIVGFDGLRDFYPELIAENLSKQGYSARAASLPVSTITDRRDFNTVQLAKALEASDRASRLGRELSRLVAKGERIGLPAILGVDEHERVMAELRKQSTAEVFEIPTLPPSVPGIRLFNRLRDHLLGMGVRVEAGMHVIMAESVAATNGTPARVAWVATETSARPLKHRAGKFLLATGGILGGGFDSDSSGHVWETVFDLPLTTPQVRRDWFRPSFINPEGHPVFLGGVQTDSNLRPVDGDGNVIFDNLWAAGNALSNCDTIQERSMEGVAIATGAAAGQAIAA